MTWPRREVTDVKVNSYSGQLLVRAHGREMVEYKLSPSREVTEWVARRLTEALHAPLETAPTPSVPPSSLAGEKPALEAGKRLVVGLSACMFGVGVVMFCLGLPVFGWFLILASAVSAGLTLGTQDKEYYL